MGVKARTGGRGALWAHRPLRFSRAPASDVRRRTLASRGPGGTGWMRADCRCRKQLQRLAPPRSARGPRYSPMRTETGLAKHPEPRPHSADRRRIEAPHDSALFLPTLFPSLAWWVCCSGMNRAPLQPQRRPRSAMTGEWGQGNDGRSKTAETGGQRLNGLEEPPARGPEIPLSPFLCHGLANGSRVSEPTRCASTAVPAGSRPGGRAAKAARTETIGARCFPVRVLSGPDARDRATPRFGSPARSRVRRHGRCPAASSPGP